jgi:hypothetical protein
VQERRRLPQNKDLHSELSSKDHSGLNESKEPVKEDIKSPG